MLGCLEVLEGCKQHVVPLLSSRGPCFSKKFREQWVKNTPQQTASDRFLCSTFKGHCHILNTDVSLFFWLCCISLYELKCASPVRLTSCGRLLCKLLLVTVPQLTVESALLFCNAMMMELEKGYKVHFLLTCALCCSPLKYILFGIITIRSVSGHYWVMSLVQVKGVVSGSLRAMCWVSGKSSLNK